MLQRGRRKAYRPLPAETRASAIDAGLLAYARGDFFLAHELLEPAWMGTSDLAERDLLQGLIKVAAAYVHGVRGNAAGVRKNLEGARDLLASAGSSSQTASRLGVDASRLVVEIDARLAGPIAAGDAPIEIRTESTSRGEALEPGV